MKGRGGEKNGSQKEKDWNQKDRNQEAQIVQEMMRKEPLSRCGFSVTQESGKDKGAPSPVFRKPIGY